MALITVNNVSFSYESNVVCKDLSFQVKAGDYLCIVGENGSGKSTLIKGILGLQPKKEGSIQFEEGLEQTHIGYLPQQTTAQKDFPASVYEVVLSGRLNKRGIRPFYSMEDKRVAKKNMERLGITNLMRACYRELSGGQQQRVLLARALCATEQVIILDEPVAGLDPVVTAELYELIRKINKEMGITIIMISHDIQTAVKEASHILHMHKEERFYGTTKDYLSSSLSTRFLGGENNDGTN